MSEISFYRLAILLPLMIPAIAVLPLAHFPSALDSTAGWVLGFLVSAAVAGGAPYILFCVGLLLWLRTKSERTYLAASLVAPLLFAAFLAACAITLSVVEGPPYRWAAAGYYALFALAAGYFYVVITHGLRLVLRRAGFVRTSPAAG